MMRRKRIVTALIALAALGLAMYATAVLVLKSDWFKNKVRERIIAEVEQATGGRVEIGSFNYNWGTSTADVGPFVLHGTERAGDPPLLRAARIRVGLKIISFIGRRADIASLEVEKPEIHVVVNANGTTNVPTPKAVSQRRGSPIAEILRLKIGHATVANGVVEYNAERTPLNLRADNVTMDLRYFALPARYAGEMSAHQVHVTVPGVRDAAFDFATKLVVEQDRVQVQSARVSLNRSVTDLSGTIMDLAAPHANLDVKARLFVADLARSIKLPIESRGEVAFSGKAAVQFAPFRYSINGRVNGRDLAYAAKDIELRNFTVTSRVEITPEEVKLPNIDLAAASGHFHGALTIEDGKRFRVAGKIDGFSVQQLAALQGTPSGELNGSVSGPVQAEGMIAKNGIQDLKAHGTLQITPGKTGVPLEGSIEVQYDERAGLVQLGNWNMMLGTSQVTASGNLGQSLTVHVTSKNLDDLMAAMPLIGQKVQSLPMRLVRGGTARFDGTITGPLKEPRIAGQLELTTFEAAKEQFNHLVVNFDATRSNLNVRTLAVDGDQLHSTASGRLGLVDWAPQDQSPVQASVSLRSRVEQVSKSVLPKVPISGSLAATGTISGTYGSPHATGHVQADGVIAYDQPFDRVAADVTYGDQTVEFLKGRAVAGKAEVDFSGAYNHSGVDWTSGRLRVTSVGRGFALTQIKAVTTRRQGLEGQLDFEGTGTAHFIKGDFELDDLDARGTLSNAIVDGKPLGNMQATAKTRGQVLDVRADADLRGTKVEGQGEWRLAGDYPGKGEITIPRMTFATLKDLIPANTGGDLPFGGFLSASVKITGALKKPDSLIAEVTVPELQINASSNTQPRAGAQATDLVLRSARPLQFDVSLKGADVKSAQFVGTDTTVTASGRIGFTDKDPWNLRVNGSINLATLQLFNYDLLASGVSTLNATIRGPLKQPEVNGRLELKNASLYLSDLPNGVEKANGLILFDHSRATIQNLSGESGGGNVTFQAGSFVGFSGPLLIYRVQAAAEHVRYRSPEGMSVTADASLSLAGTSERSTLSGTVTVIRAAFLPQTDVGSMLASTAKPVSVPTTPNAYVRGIQFDIRIDSSQNLEVVTSLTRDIEAEANLRLRGNVDRPILLGSISVSQGEIDFFGNKYTINRGEVNFLNPAKLEPIVNMDLEARVRGITVDITFTGTLSKLSFTYRSDPPLESNQIIALLAVGRAPVGVGALASSQATNSSYLSSGGNALLAQAITAPTSGRLQRFFGVSHIKIDPQLTDITSVPQARVTLEQQISKDITLTYVTNLSRTSEQVVRVEWNFSRRWSVVAVREENGLFGLDVQYRKTFK